MESLLQRTSDHPLVPIGGLLLGIIGVTLAIVFYFRNRRTSKVKYDWSGGSLVEGLSGALDDVELRYKGELQDRITVTRFVFWNAGTETLRADDFTDDPLRISTKPGINILDHRIIHAPDPTNKISLSDAVAVTDEEVSITITFDYLDAKDGAVIQLVHDGPDSTRFELTGSLKGKCSISEAESPAFRAKKLFPIIAPFVRFRAVGWLGALTYLVVAIVALLLPLLGKGSWWLLALSAFAWLGTWVMFYAYVFGQVPSRLQSEMSRLPKQGEKRGATANSQ